MQIETDDVMIGLAWNLEEAEEMLRKDKDEGTTSDLPIILLALVFSPDEEMAREYWREKYPDLEINTIVPLNTLINEGAAS